MRERAQIESLVPALLALVTLAGCLGPLDNPTTVRDLRILGIALDPPEITFPVHGGGGAGGLSCQPDFSPIAAVPTVHLQALVGDPAGQGRSLHFTFTGCPQTGTEICPDGGGYVLAEGDAPAPLLSAQWALGAMVVAEVSPPQACAAPQNCPATPLVAAFASNPLGLCRFGVWFQVGLQVDAPDGQTIYGSKLMVFTPVPDDYPSDPAICPQGPAGGPPPHTNPRIEALELDGQALPLDSAPVVSASVSHTLTPLEPSSGPQPYCLPTYDGNWVNLTETWVFSAVTDVGQFDRLEVGGAAAPGSDQLGKSTDLNFTWTFPDGGPGRTADLYAVTRDGRGGTSWIIRHAAVTP